MSFPKALKGIKIIHMAELVTLLLTVSSLGLLVLEQLVENETVLEAVSWGILVLGLLALGLELAGILTAAKDERAFRSAGYGMILTLVLSFAVLFLGEGEVLRTVVELFCIIPTIYCSTTVIKGIMRLAEKLDDKLLLGRKSFLIRAVVLLSLGAMVLEFTTAFLLRGHQYETLHAIFHTMILTMELVEVSIFLGCTSQAEKMLHHAGEHHAESPAEPEMIS